MATLTAAIDSASGLVIVTGATSGADGIPAAIGDPLTIAGAVQTAYNGNFITHTTDGGGNFTYLLATSTVPVTPATGTITARVYANNSPLLWRTVASAAGYTREGNFTRQMFILDGNTGRLYLLDANAARDQVGIVAQDDSFIDFRIITPRLDLQSNLVKFISRLEVIGDDTAVKALIRYSDDDYNTWSTYQQVDMGHERPRLSRQGSTRRRAYEFRKPYDRVVDNGVGQPLRVEALELFIKQGTNS